MGPRLRGDDSIGAGKSVSLTAPRETAEKGRRRCATGPSAHVERNAGEDTGSRDDRPAEQGGGSGPCEVKPEVAT
jgi:hypothetical protein